MRCAFANIERRQKAIMDGLALRSAHDWDNPFAYESSFVRDCIVLEGVGRSRSSLGLG